jgi:peptidoglycan/LPS O-acetylase OafA/YrhL
MRSLGLSLALVIIGVALIGGFLTQVVPDEYVPSGLRSLGLYVGTNGSVAGAIFGTGLLWAATNPRRHIAWVVLTIVYAVLLVLYQAYAAIVLHNPWELAPIIFGLLGGMLVAALYPSASPRPEPRPAVSPPQVTSATPATTPAPPKPAHPARPKAVEGGQEN